MPSLSDLKNDGNEERFIPHVKNEDETVVDQRDLANMSSPVINVPKKPTAVSMTNGSERERVKADFSDLPEKEQVGVEKRESLVKDILGPGGPFDSYLENKKKEMQADVEEWEAQAELEGKQIAYLDNNGELVVPTEEDELEKNNKVEQNTTYKETDDLFADEDEDEEDMEPVVEKVEEPTVVESEDIFDEEEIVTETVVEDVQEEKEEIVEEEEIEIEAGTTISEEIKEDTDIIDEDEDEVKDAEEEAEAAFESFKKMVTEKIKPVAKKMDISSFTIAKKPSVNNTITATKEVAVAKWVLPSTGITVRMKEFLGADLERLRSVIQNNDARGTLQLVYDHIVSPKPGFEAWLKSIAYDDYDHLFMAVYVASFSGANYMPVDCANKACKGKTYVTDDIPFNQLVKYKDDKAKKEFKKIYAEEPQMVKPLIATEVVPISNTYAIGFRIPSIYSVMIETGYFDQEFIRKHASAISLAPYIDAIYEIDYNRQELIPIGYKEYVNNDGKTAKSKIVKYSKIINTLTSDEIATIRALTESINKNNDMITYQTPDTTCPHCNHQNIGEPQQAASMVFLRNQLALLVNT